MRGVLGFRVVLLGLIPFGPIHAQSTPCPPPDSLAGNGAIVGRVVDAETQVSLGFTQLRLRVLGVEAPLETQSSPSGRFQFCSVPAGMFTLTGQLGQFGALLGPVGLEPGQTLTLSLELTTAPSGRDTGTLTGRVVDSESGNPIHGVTVLLPSLGQTAISNSKGNFTFPSLPPGEFNLQVNHLGYSKARGQVEVEVGKTVHTRVSLSSEPIALDPIIVTAVRRRIVLPGLEDFERRYHSGWGRFVLEEEIRVRSPRRLSDVLEFAGTVVNGSLGFEGLRIRRTGCAPLVYLDGMSLTRCSRGGGPPPRPGEGCDPAQEAFEVVNLIHPTDVVAVEVYRGPAETPGQYLDSNARCGVILVWTRRGKMSGG